MGRVKQIDCPYLTTNFKGEFVCTGTKEIDPCNFPNCSYGIEAASAQVTMEPAPSKEKPSRKVITLCGSTRFKNEFLEMLEILTLCGWVVLLPGYFGHCARFPVSDEVKESLDALHKKKIDMSDAIYVLNIDGYIGESTRSEIEYAILNNKEIIYYE